jgi:hypothetical protein
LVELSWEGPSRASPAAALHPPPPANGPSISMQMVVGVCGAALADASTYTKDVFESGTSAATEPPSAQRIADTPADQGLPLPRPPADRGV